MKELSIRKVLQDISAIVGSLLPIIQLFFSQWVYAFDHVFLAKEQFLGISIVTLILSYILIIAYLANPYGEIILPFQGKKQKALQAHWNKRNSLEAQLNTLVTLPDATTAKVSKVYNEIQNLNQPDAPIKIDQNNQVKVVVGFVIVSAMVFTALAFTKAGDLLLAGIQAVAYVVFIALSALMLTIYKRNSDNANSWSENNRTRVNRAIKLAIDANGFGDLPQVTFVNQSEVGGYVGNLQVRASYKQENYDIITDRDAKYLISIRKEVSQAE